MVHIVNKLEQHSCNSRVSGHTSSEISILLRVVRHLDALDVQGPSDIRHTTQWSALADGMMDGHSDC